MNNIEVVITSYNQGKMILEAVNSVCAQTKLPKRIIIVDDGSTEEDSIQILKELEMTEMSVPIVVKYQQNKGVSAARNIGISIAQTSFVLVLDGDDRLQPTYIEKVSQLLQENTAMVAASSWMQTFGTLQAVVKPTGGNIVPFLARNCCPATHMFSLSFRSFIHRSSIAWTSP